MSYLLIWMNGGEYEDEYNQIETALWTREVGVGVGNVADKGVAAGRAVVVVVLSENINIFKGKPAHSLTKRYYTSAFCFLSKGSFSLHSLEKM